MSLPATLFFVYLVVGVLFALVAVIAKKKEGGFWSSYPWAAEPALFGIAIVFWPITFLVLMFSGSKKRKTEPNQPPPRNAGNRPSSDDSPASETPSSPGPRG